MGKRIVMTTFGSLGDLNPFIAVAHGLQERGHDVVIATGEGSRAHVESANIAFHPTRPPWDPEATDLTSGLFRDLHASFYDLRAAVRGADLLVTLNAAYAGSSIKRINRSIPGT